MIAGLNPAIRPTKRSKEDEIISVRTSRRGNPPVVTLGRHVCLPLRQCLLINKMAREMIYI